MKKFSYGSQKELRRSKLHAREVADEKCEGGVRWELRKQITSSNFHYYSD